MARLTIEFDKKANKAFPNRTKDELNALMWLVVQNESNPIINNGIHQTDDEVINSMKKIDKIYTDNYDVLKQYKSDNRTLQMKLEAIVFDFNIVKSTCQELGITQKELAERIGVTPSAISQWGNEIPKTAQVALELMIENNTLKKDLQAIIKGHEVLTKLAVQNLDS